MPVITELGWQRQEDSEFKAGETLSPNNNDNNNNKLLIICFKLSLADNIATSKELIKMLLVLTKWRLENKFCFKKIHKDNGRSEKIHF